MTFNNKLILLRKQRSWSQEQLGDTIGVSRQTISKWELGDTTPEMEKLIQLSNVFEISIDALICHEPYESNTTKAEMNLTDNTIVIRSSQWHYEYKSKKMFRGIPLIHINLGRGGIHKAKGILAIGTIAKGVISIGIISLGILSFGACSIGMLSLGALSLGLLLSFGAISVGTISFGGIAVGILAFGGLSVGMYSLGGVAVASKIAAGGFAQAPIAIGDKTNGNITFDINQTILETDIKNTILHKFPGTWRLILDLFSKIHH